MAWTCSTISSVWMPARPVRALQLLYIYITPLNDYTIHDDSFSIQLRN